MEPNTQLLFSNYLLGKMTQQERQDFERRLADDSSLYDAFNEFKMATFLGQRQHHNEIKSRVSSIVHEENESSGKWKTLKTIAAIAAVLVLVYGVWKFIYQEETIEELYATYYEVPPYSSIRSDSDSLDYYDQALTFYAQENWSSAIRSIEKLDSTQISDSKVRRVLAHAFLNSDRNIEAIEALRAIVSDAKTNTASDYWYLGLAYLKIQEIDSAEVYLQTFVDKNEDSPYQDKVRKILQNIKK